MSDLLEVKRCSMENEQLDYIVLELSKEYANGRAVERRDWGPGRNWSRGSSAGLPGDGEETLRDAAELRRGGASCTAPLIGGEGASLRVEERQVRLGPEGRGSAVLRSARAVEAESCPGGPCERRLACGTQTFHQ
ncbi:hypothetical protein NDU88_005672 [Pleurodeles waltl]|uniref:Uncharacterized protein n=1 Tax=Pleurodeles waltl TaxID=8319 RepID=A0AAV7TBF4_PLEWA|nr:hypothetical protein NDU88_005672 [Pleurodeles waltl]